MGTTVLVLQVSKWSRLMMILSFMYITVFIMCEVRKSLVKMRGSCCSAFGEAWLSRFRRDALGNLKLSSRRSSSSQGPDMRTRCFPVLLPWSCSGHCCPSIWACQVSNLCTCLVGDAEMQQLRLSSCLKKNHHLECCFCDCQRASLGPYLRDALSLHCYCCSRRHRWTAPSSFPGHATAVKLRKGCSISVWPFLAQNLVSVIRFLFKKRYNDWYEELARYLLPLTLPPRPYD